MSILPDDGRGEVFLLPDRLPGKFLHARHGCTAFGGLAGEGGASADTLCAMSNLTPCGYPALVTGNARPLYLTAPTEGAAHGLTVHRGKIIFVQGTGLFSSSACGRFTRLGTVGDTDKRFASFGELLFILPDGLVYDASDGSLRAFAADTGDMENVTIDNVYLTVPSGGLTEAGFRAGDGIRLDVADDGDAAAALNGYYRISDLTDTHLCVEGGFPARGSFTARVRRVMPDPDGLCAVGDRLYGFAGQSVFACEAGNPWNWYWADPASPETAPFCLSAAGEGVFTACCAWQGYPLFFRENGICRLTGRAYAAGRALSVSGVALTEQSAPGISAGQAAALCTLDGALYYCSRGDVYRYAGGTPSRVSNGLPEGVRGVCAGSDGRGVYLSAAEADGVVVLYLYSPGKGWYRQEEVSAAALSRPTETASGQGNVCLLQREDGNLYLLRSFGAALREGFTAAAVPTPDAAAEFGDDTSLLPDGGRLLAVHIRARGNVGSLMRLYVRYDGDGAWQPLGSVAGTGKEELTRIPVPPRPCHWFRLRLEFSGAGESGHQDGAFRIYGIWRDTEQSGR